MQEEQQLVVAPVMSDQKWITFKHSILETLTGIHQDNLSCHRIQQLILLFPITFFIPLFVNNKLIALIVPTAINFLLNLMEDLLRSQTIKLGTIIIRNIVLGIYTFLWANHVYFLKQDNSTEIYNFVFSAISILTSVYTVARLPVKEFSANGLENDHIGMHSTLYMRFFIALPLLLPEFIIYNTSILSPNNSHLFPLRLITSLIFLTWWLACISSLKTTLQFILNTTSKLILGNQSESNFKGALIGVINNMIPITIFIITYRTTGDTPINTIMIGATMTSIATFARYNCFWNRISTTYKRAIILIIVQLIIMALLVVLYLRGNLSNLNLSVFLIIDLAIYLITNIIKQLLKGWSIFGLNFNLQCIQINIVNLVQRILLRLFSALCILIILNNYQNQFLSLLPYDRNILNYTALPFLAFRSFKRCIADSSSFTLHFSLLLCLILINTGLIAQGTLLVLIMPIYPPWIWTAFLSIFKIPPKLLHKNECCYQVGYFLTSLFGFTLYFATLGIFQLTMILGLPIYFPIIPTQTQGFQVKSAQNSLYQKILQNINKSIFRFYQKGFYLLRIQKYILMLQVKSNCFGFCQLLDIRGLQVQEVTSCHSKEGQTIDKLVEETWGDNKKRCSCSPYQYALTPFTKEKVSVPTQNDIQLVGIIESSQFVSLFKTTALMSIIRQFSKLHLSQNQMRQAEGMAGQLPAIFKKDAAQSLFPFDFANACSLKAAYPIQSGKVRLPPLTKGKKPEMVNDFMDLLQNSNQKFQNTNSNLLSTQKKQSKLDQTLNFPKIQELNMTVILTFYYYAIGKQDYINTSKIYRLIKRQTDTVTQIEFDQFNTIISLALGAAFKISIDKYIEGETKVSLQDFQQYEKSSFLGTSDSEQFKTAILEDKEHIWTLTYSKKTLAIKRLAHSQTDMYVFKVDEAVLKGVWNNLRFQLIYAANNDDQRYSIQTHPNLMRNLWVEACQQPFGYPSYHSGPLINI